MNTSAFPTLPTPLAPRQLSEVARSHGILGQGLHATLQRITDSLRPTRLPTSPALLGPRFSPSVSWCSLREAAQQ